MTSALRRLWRWRLLRAASRGEIAAMRKLAAKNDPDYRDAMRSACLEVLGEDPYGC